MKLKKKFDYELFHPTKGEIDFSTADYKTLLALSKTKGYEHLI